MARSILWVQNGEPSPLRSRRHGVLQSACVVPDWFFPVGILADLLFAALFLRANAC
jgi:hypothetical protein